MVSEQLFDDLVALEESSFPKKCATCGVVYKNIEEFTARTAHVNGSSGLKSAEGDEGETILELFRNCECGSTLLDFFADRRDMSAQGENRRLAFDKVLQHLIENGITEEAARLELKHYLRHKKSDLFDKLKVLRNTENEDKAD